jgi:hypothetical protein
MERPFRNMNKQSADAGIHEEVENLHGELGKPGRKGVQSSTPQAGRSHPGANNPKPNQPGSNAQPPQKALTNAERLAALKASTPPPPTPDSTKLTPLKQQLEDLKASQPQSSRLTPSSKPPSASPRSRPSL